MTSSSDGGDDAYPRTRPDSNVVQWDENTRAARLVGVMWYTSTREVIASNGTTTKVRAINHRALWDSVAGFLAYKHFNERRGDVLPHLPELVGDCNFHWSFEFRDSKASGFHAVSQLARAIDIGQEQNASSWPRMPFAILGGWWSGVSKQLSLLGAGYELPQISGVSVSPELDNSPFFARTVPNSKADANAAIQYYKSLGVDRFACLYVKDTWGANSHAALLQCAIQEGISVASFAYEKHDIESTILLLKESGYKYVYAIMHSWRQVLKVAYPHGIVGQPDYAWTGALQNVWAGPNFAVDRANEPDIAASLHGITTIDIHYEPNALFEAALDEIHHNTSLQEEFVSHQAEPELFDDFEWPKYNPNSPTFRVFDAVLGLGLSACNESLPPLFTGTEHYEALVHTKFTGVSGNVAFDPNTGTREMEDIKFAVSSIRLSEKRSDDQYFRFDSDVIMLISGSRVDHLVNQVFNDNTTTPPLPYPPILDKELNLISPAVRAIGYGMAGCVILVALACWTWTCTNRERFVVRAAQPIFLVQLCLGTIVMASAVFPMSLPGSSPHVGPHAGLDMACQSTLYLFFLGFVIAFSAIAAKSSRLLKLIKSGQGMRRIQVDPQDVVLPFLGLTGINLTMLLCITFFAPYRYARLETASYDTYGRSLESYGTCRPDNQLFYAFLVPMCVVDFVGVVVATFQTYKARHMPTQLSESSYLAISTGSLLESLALGGPILAVVYSSPTPFYLVGSALICMGCMAFLLPIFVPKYLNRRQKFSSTLASIQMGNSVGGTVRHLRDSVRSGGSGMSSVRPSLPGQMAIVRRRIESSELSSIPMRSDDFAT